MSPICEIRLLTYKRPEWLRRAIKTAVEQDYQDVRVIVQDDAPGPVTEAVIASFNDPRILYRPNPTNLGCAANTDLAFGPEPVAGGEYFCLLEDDNWLRPTYVSANIDCLKRSGTHVLLRNQEVWTQTADATAPTGRTTRGGFLPDGIVAPLTLRASIFFGEGISHGGMFWDARKASDLVVGPAIADAGIAEHCRTLQVAEPIYFGAEPLAVFSDIPPVGTLRARPRTADRSFGRARQAIVTELIRQHGTAILDEAKRIAARLGRDDDYERALVDALRPSRGAARLGLAGLPKMYAKAIAKRLFAANPLGGYDVPRLPAP